MRSLGLSRFERGFVSLWKESGDTLLSPAADVLLAGGLSLLAFLALTLFVSRDADKTAWIAGTYYASFFVNYPHFAVSYQILYGDTRRDFFRFAAHPLFTARLWWTGLFAPLLMTTYLGYCMWARDAALMGYAVNLMYFLVGWHYVKQIFGCVIVLSSLKGVYFNRYERLMILVPLYSLWFTYVFASNALGDMSQYLSVPYSRFAIPEPFLDVTLWIFVASTALMVGMFGHKHMREKKAPPLSALVALASIYVWLTPVSVHPLFLLVIPFFHSLQYLLFVVAYKRNRILASMFGRDEARKRGPRWARFRRLSLWLTAVIFLILPAAAAVLLRTQGSGEYGFEHAMSKTVGMLTLLSSTLWMRSVVLVALLLCALLLLRKAAKQSVSWHFLQAVVQMLLLGGLLFSLAPALLDGLAHGGVLPGTLKYDNKIFGPTLYLFIFTVFINIHHFFIDNAIWRRENPNMREYLFG